MDKEAGRCTNADILDLSVLSSGEQSHLNCHSDSWNGSLTDLNEAHSRNNIRNKQVLLGAALSKEELKIRSELEMDIERDLEQEIKDGIYHHALRLHQLYQQRRERNEREVSALFETQSQQIKNNNKTLLEVNISIKMEGGTKIEIKESNKKEAPEKGRPGTSRSENMQAVLMAPKSKKFDWAKTLRSNAGPFVINRQNNASLTLARTPSNGHSRYPNLSLDTIRRNCTSASGLLKIKASGENKIREQGWKV
ncbi:hypothetical protein ACB098_02G188000 [Castanea mollissima]|uniref:Uncharacterized protein n=1 Tax=Castanea mollissima TaxID=60419 RepID=A0A8J4VNS0_9ROSI|nr:hypothetical protein CMV_011485 [Castanea mollissima]